MVDPNLGERVATLEGLMVSLTKNVDRLVLSEIESNRTPWGTLLTAVTVAITIGGIAGTAYVAPLNAKLDNLSQQQERIARDYTDLKNRVENKRGR